MINPIQGSKFPQVAMHIDSLLLPKSKTSNTYSPASPPDLLIPTSHPPQNGWALCGLLMPKDKLPLTYFTTGKGNPVETEAGKYKIFKMSIKKKVLWLHKNHLEKFGKDQCFYQVCPVCSANIEISSDSECLHCHCDFYLLPLLHTFHIWKELLKELLYPTCTITAGKKSV